MKKKDIALIVIVGILNITALTMAIAWKYWFSLIACVVCVIMYCFVVYNLIKGAREQKQKNLEFIKPDNKKDFDLFVNGISPCDACGKNHKAPNSQLCKECIDKINERYKDWW